jgi:hypothetical protein
MRLFFNLNFNSKLAKTLWRTLARHLGFKINIAWRIGREVAERAFRLNLSCMPSHRLTDADFKQIYNRYTSMHTHLGKQRIHIIH